MTRNEAKVQAQEVERLRQLAAQRALEQAEVARQQERASLAAQARHDAEQASIKAERDAAKALQKQKDDLIQAEERRRQEERRNQDNVNLLGDIFDDQTPSTTSSATPSSAIYTHADGREESVHLIKTHSPSE